ncbi:MAG TPA: type II secretion system protein GspL [Nevskiaceae bacterium]
MRETLYIRWKDDPESVLAYAIVATETPDAVDVHEAPRDTLFALANTHRTVLIVDAADVQLATVSVPTRQRAKALQAIPYLLEEQLTEDIDTLHFALGGGRLSGDYSAAVVARATLRAWLSPFHERGTRPVSVISETSCLPSPEADDPWSVMLDGTRAIVRCGRDSGFGCGTQDLPAMLSIADQGEAPHALRIWTAGDSVPELGLGERSMQWSPGFVHPLQILVRSYRAADAVNLLQGEYAQREELHASWRPWRTAAALALAAFALAWFTNAAWVVRNNYAANAQELANAQRFYQLFPAEPRSLALPLAIRQVAARAGDAQASTGRFLPLLQQTAGALAAIHGMTVQELQFRDHALYATVSGDDLQALDRLRTWFASHPSTRMEVQDAGANGNRMRAVIRVTAG